MFDPKMFAPGGPWDRVASSFDTLGLHSARLRPTQSPGGYGLDRIHAAVDWLTRNQKKIAVEAFAWAGSRPYGKYPMCDGTDLAKHDFGYVLAPTGEFGETTAGGMSEILKRGGRVDYVLLDGPISRLVEGGRSASGRSWEDACSLSYEQTRANTVNYLSWIKNAFVSRGQTPPKFIYLVNFSNWTYDGLPGYRSMPEVDQPGFMNDMNFRQVLDDVTADARAAGVPFYGLMLDHPWDHLRAPDVAAGHRGAWLGGCCGRASKRWEWWPKRLVLTCATLKDERYSAESAGTGARFAAPLRAPTPARPTLDLAAPARRLTRLRGCASRA
jgi:hypothetical protein